jgi:hypothetical protein
LRTAGSPVSVAGAASPSAGQVLTAVNATAANWQTPVAAMANPAFTLQPNAVAALLEWTTVAYFPWVAARHAGYTPTIVYWNSAIATSLDIRLYDDSELGVVTPGPHSFTCVDPVGNSSVVLQVKKNGGGTSPQIYGVLIYFD